MIRAVLRSTISISVIFFVYVSIEVYATQKKKAETRHNVYGGKH